MSDRFFWEWLEQVWRATPDGEAIRAEIARGVLDDAAARECMRPFFDTLERWFGHLTKDGLAAFGGDFVRARFALDGEDLARHLGLGDDSFADARAVNVFLGEAHYRRVKNDVGAATPVALEEAALVLSRHWEKRYGEPLPRLGPDPSSARNPDGWPRVGERCAAEARVRAAVDQIVGELRIGGRGPGLASGESLVLTLPALRASELALVFKRVAAKLGEEA